MSFSKRGAPARIMLATAREMSGGSRRAFILAIHRDQACWFGVLTKAIHRLDGVPSAKTDAFYDKALALPDFVDRLASLNRGQAWVVRNLEALLPKIRDEAIRADLAAMSHRTKRTSIELAFARSRPSQHLRA